ncbi:MAG: EamA family transporter [Clostridia bacterium]|nr:EamA family transporter [Clostridia bacterium]
MNNEKKVLDKNKKNLIRNILILQAIIAVYTLSSVVAKFASGKEFLSIEFIVLYGVEILILGIYAVLWQQIIKKFQISIAYANRAMSLLWAILWAVVFFHEEVTIKNIIGVIIVIIGTIIVNKDE